MNEIVDTFLYKLWFFVVGILIITSLILLPFLLPVIWKSPTAKAQAARSNSTDSAAKSNMEDSPNILTSGMFKAGDKIGQITSIAEQTVSDSFGSVTKSVSTAAASSARFAAHSVSSGANLIAQGMSNSVKFMVEGTGNTVGFIANTSPVSAIIRPADTVEIPVIDTNLPDLPAAQSALPVIESAPPPQVNEDTSWPINGAVTTEFGVPHWPYQPLHTGMDISDGRRSNTTPIKPFKPGLVVETVRSKVGLGYYVVVDHGKGMTSVYAHFASISAVVGQEVNRSTTLGFEGSTGASTGTHLHFEIRLSGRPVDPRLYISGQP